MRSGDVLAGKYVVERVLGAGGMGVVVAARHQQLGGRVALKFMLPDLTTSDQVVRRFLREARAASSITSEHVARVSDVGTLEHGEPYIVMEYLEGHDLGRELELRGPLPSMVAVDYVMQGLQAIAEAHAKGIVHRDLKPSNLFLTHRADGSPLVKVLDFGIAKAALADAPVGRLTLDSTGSSPFVGSPCYASPEQIRNTKDLDPRSDIWAIGVVLYELLTGQLPFIADEIGSLVAAILTDAPPSLRRRRPDVPAAVDRAVLACLEKDRERRTASVAELATALAPFGSADARLSLARISGIAGQPGSRPPVGERRGGRGWKAAALAGGLATALAMVVLVRPRLSGEGHFSNGPATVTPRAAAPTSAPSVRSSAAAPVEGRPTIDGQPTPDRPVPHVIETPRPNHRAVGSRGTIARRQHASSRTATEKLPSQDLDELFKNRK